MPILNYTTSIDVSKTMGEIQGALARRGIRSISTLYDEDGTPAGLAFTMRTEYGYRDFELPVRTAGVLAAMRADPKVTRSACNPAQAARVAWRIAKDWLEAQSALIDAGLASLDEVMFPYMVTTYDEGRAITMFDTFREKQLAITASADPTGSEG